MIHPRTIFLFLTFVRKNWYFSKSSIFLSDFLGELCCFHLNNIFCVIKNLYFTLTIISFNFNHFLIDATDLAYINSLSSKQKRRLLKRLNKLERQSERIERKQKRQRLSECKYQNESDSDTCNKQYSRPKRKKRKKDRSHAYSPNNDSDRKSTRQIKSKHKYEDVYLKRMDKKAQDLNTTIEETGSIDRTKKRKFSPSCTYSVNLHRENKRVDSSQCEDIKDQSGSELQETSVPYYTNTKTSSCTMDDVMKQIADCRERSTSSNIGKTFTVSSTRRKR